MDSRAIRFADGSSVVLNKEWRYQLPPAECRVSVACALGGNCRIGRDSQRHDCAARRISACAASPGIKASPTPMKATKYQALLTRFMADWRTQFGASVPFFVVQLAELRSCVDATRPRAAGRSYARSAAPRRERRMRTPGSLIAIDLGERTDVHPANKQEVARRARACRATCRLRKDARSGVRSSAGQSARREGDAVSR